MLCTHCSYTEDALFSLVRQVATHSLSGCGGNDNTTVLQEEIIYVCRMYTFTWRVLQNFLFPNQVKIWIHVSTHKTWQCIQYPWFLGGGGDPLLPLAIKVSEGPKQSLKLRSPLCFAIWSPLSWSLHDRVGVTEDRVPFPLTSHPINLRPVILSLVPDGPLGREKHLTYFLNSFHKS